MGALIIDDIGGAEGDRTPDLMTASSKRFFGGGVRSITISEKINFFSAKSTVFQPIPTCLLSRLRPMNVYGQVHSAGLAINF